MPARASSSPDVLDIRPGVGILSVFAHLNYKPWFALAEYVDNSIQSYLTNKRRLRANDGRDYHLRIAIKFSRLDGGSVSIWDNAAGIAAKDYRRAFQTAQPPPDVSGLSLFGMGMKSASCWFARNFEVKTKALEEPVERDVQFDVPKITRLGLERLVPRQVPAARSEHFTEIRLWNLNKIPETKTLAKMKLHLVSIFRCFLRSGEVAIDFNEEPLQFVDPPILRSPDISKPGSKPRLWRKQLDFGLPGEKRVEGFAAIRETGSTSRAGLALFRNNRLIQGSDDEAYRPSEIFGASNSYRYQRLFGELHLTGFDVSHTKDGFIWGDSEVAFLTKLRQHMDSDSLPLLRQAENYRARTTAADLKSGAERSLKGAAAAVGGLGPIVNRQIDNPSPSVLPPMKMNARPSASKRDVRLKVGEDDWIVTLDLSADPATTDWLSLFDTQPSPKGAAKKGQPRRLGIRVSLLHPFMIQFGNQSVEQMEPLVRIAAGVALAETTARESGVKRAGAIRRNLNDLLRGALAQPARVLHDPAA